MRQGLIAALLSIIVLTALSLATGDAAVDTSRAGLPALSSMNARIVDAALGEGGAYAFLQRLTGTIGPRLTGTDRSRAAADLLIHTLTTTGLENVHAEAYRLRSRWRRGTASARIVRPAVQDLSVQSFGWAPGTRGTRVSMVVDAGTVVSTTVLPPLSSGAIVLADFPGDSLEPAYVTRARTARTVASARAAALLVPSDKPDGLLDIACFGNYPAAPLPMLSIAREDARLLRRRLARGPVQVSLEVENALDATPTTERNVIAEWRGSSMPDRVILVGGHFDSWDTGTGANDDGSGVATVLETARILQSLGVRGRRTIRFVFFSGEEQAILGSRAYVAAHGDELDRIDAVVIMDEGAGVPRGFRLHGRTDLDAPVRRILRPLAALDAAALSLDASVDQDHAYFLAAGVPALTLWVKPGNYPTNHHAATDTLDTIDPRALGMDTAVIATAALALADAGRIGRRLTPSERTELLRRTGLDGALAALALQ
jgi:hypothetical protein